MNENQTKSNNLLDTTDCLEAIGVFRGWKNFLFVIVALCLLLLQTSFWLVDTGWVPARLGSASSRQRPEPEPGKPGQATGVARIGICEQDESNEAAVVGGAPHENIQDVNEAAKKVAANANQQAEAISKKPQQPTTEKSLFGITFRHLAWLVRFVDVLLVLAATLYCLTMLFSLKISLIGRLGGINHICRAFFLSLIMLVLLLPWQRAFGCVVIGAIYTPSELVQSCAAESRGIFGISLHYLRFSGYWLLIVLLLILSQVRSCRWAKAILRRLEVI